jgi:tetratricopeptide (TPR) repeat protein
MLRKILCVLLVLLLPGFVIHGQNRHVIDSLKMTISESEPDTNKIKLLISLANNYYDVEQDSSVYFLNRALVLAREINEPRFKALVMMKLGSDYCFKGEYLKSLEYLDLAENIIGEFPDKPILAEIYSIKSIVFISINRFQLALQFANKALKAYTELEYNKKLSFVYTIFSNIYKELGDMQQSIEFTKKAHNFVIHENDSTAIASSLNNLGASYHDIGNQDSAFAYIRQAVYINLKHNLDKRLLAISYMNLASFKLEDGEIDSANFFMEKADTLFQATDYLYEYDMMRELKANIFLAKNKTEEAIDIYESIINSPGELENLQVKVNAYKALSDIANSAGKANEAYNLYKKFKLFDDSLKKETNTSLLTFMEMELEYDKKQSRLELENKEVKIRSQRKNFLLTTLSGLIIFLIITVYFVHRMQKAKAQSLRLEKQVVEKELEHKNREIAANVMSLIKKNEILKGISKKMLEVEKSAVRVETKKAIHTLSREIQESRDVELWKEFDVRFKQVHSSFYSNLIEQFPDLSPNEQKICAFLRMNMSTKDISDITGLDPQTIDNTRSRIRKKFNIDGKTNLVSFLSNF